MSNLLLTANEIELLKNSFVGFSEVDAKEPDENEIYFVGQIRSVYAYLLEKYPEKKFVITIGQQEDALNPVAVFFFTEEGKEETYKAQIRHEGDADIISDNYYAHILAPVYDRWLNARLSESIKSGEGLEAVTAFPYLSSQLTGKESGEELAKMGSRLGRMTNIRVSGSAVSQELIEAVKKTLYDGRLYGYYTISVNGKVIASFNTFDIR